MEKGQGSFADNSVFLAELQKTKSCPGGEIRKDILGTSKL